MANLTGEYDVAMELGLGLVNSVLAAIHENEDEAYPRLPHSFTVDVDDTYRGPSDPVSEAERTGVRTTAEVQVSTPTVSLPAEGLADPIWSRSRPPVRTTARVGAAEGLEPIGPITSGSGPTCWPRITVRVNLRLWLRDRPAALPEFLHGDMYLTAGLVRTDLAGRTFLSLDQSAGADLRFEPAAGTTLSNEERALVERILRNHLRAEAELAAFKLALPAEIHRLDYDLQATGPRPSVMLMLTLGDRPPGPQGPGSVSARFLSSGADFAVAIGRDYLLGKVRTELVRGLPDQFTASAMVSGMPILAFESRR